MKSLSHILHTALLLFTIVGITVAAGENCYQEVPLPEEWYFPQNPTQANSLKKVQFSKQKKISDILKMLKEILRYQECEILSKYGEQLYKNIINYYNNTTANNILKTYDELDKQIADLKNESDENKKTTLVRSFINAIPLFLRENKKDLKKIIKLTELPQATGSIPLGYNAESIINAQAAESESLTALNTHLENFGTDNSYNYFSEIFPTLIFSTNKLSNNSQIILQQEYKYLENAMVDSAKLFAQNINEKILFTIGKKLLQNITKDARKKPLAPQIKAVIIHLICWFAIKTFDKKALLNLLEEESKNLAKESTEKALSDLLYHHSAASNIANYLKYLIGRYYPEEKKPDWPSYPTLDTTLLLQPAQFKVNKESSQIKQNQEEKSIVDKEIQIDLLAALNNEAKSINQKLQSSHKLSTEIANAQNFEKTYNEITSNQRLINLINQNKSTPNQLAKLLLTEEQKKLNESEKTELIQEKSNLITSYLEGKSSIRPIAELEKESQEIKAQIVYQYNATLQTIKENSNDVPQEFWEGKSEVTVQSVKIKEIEDFSAALINHYKSIEMQQLWRRKQQQLKTKPTIRTIQNIENLVRKIENQTKTLATKNLQSFFRKNSTQQNAQKIEFLQQLFKKKMKYADTQKAINAMIFYDRYKHKFLRWIEQPQVYLSLLGGSAVATTGFIYWLHTNKQKSHPTFAIPKKKITPKPVLQIVKKTNTATL